MCYLDYYLLYYFMWLYSIVFSFILHKYKILKKSIWNKRYCPITSKLWYIIYSNVYCELQFPGCLCDKYESNLYYIVLPYVLLLNLIITTLHYQLGRYMFFKWIYVIVTDDAANNEIWALHISSSLHGSTTMPCKLHTISFYVPQHNDIMLIGKSASAYCKRIAFGNVFFLAALAFIIPPPNQFIAKFASTKVRCQ